MTLSTIAYRPIDEQLSFGQAANTQTLGYVGRTPGTAVRDSDAWYTPSVYVESARSVMGSIDLDPFSSRAANRIIRAAYYFTPETSALLHAWRDEHKRRTYPHGVNVWLNPPYSAGFLPQAVGAFLKAYEAGDIRQAVVLVNNATETKWFHRLRSHSLAVCFPTHRIAFTTCDGKHEAGNTRGQAFFYYGPTENHTEVFVEEFAAYGWVIAREKGWA
jgi:hypothetical protein